MQTIRIYFQDLSSIDVQFSDAQAEEFRQWLRFANRDWKYSVPGEEKEIMRKDISRTEVIRENDG